MYKAPPRLSINFLKKCSNRQSGPALRPQGIDHRQLNLEHLLIQKEQRAEGLILRTRGDLSFLSEVCQKLFDFLFPHVAWVPSHVALFVEEDVTLDPARVAFLGVKAAAKSRGTKEKFAAPDGLLVTVTAGRSVTDSEIETALAHALSVVRQRLSAGVR